MKTTSAILEWYLKCPTECWLRAAGEQPSGNPYAEWKEAQVESYRAAQVERLLTEIPTGEFVRSPTPEGLKAGNWRMAADIVVSVPALSSSVPPCILESHIHAVERVASGGRGKTAQFVPIRFVFRNKLTKADRLIAAFDTMVLSAAINRKITVGKIIHGDDHGTLKVKTAALANEVRKLISKIVALLASPAPPDLILNRHCAECEYQTRCRQQALDKDDLSLLANMSEKEHKKLHGKGIFTVTQLSYTFRPRRRSKRQRDRREKYHHSLKALAIRENKIHIVGCPELKIEGTPVYLDVEGVPDRDFYYLIGLRIGNGEFAVQHSLWADTAEDECNIWRDFLNILEAIENPVLIHYGSYETVFLNRMSERYGFPPEGIIAAPFLQSGVNLLSVIYSQIYFPTYSNGLKDVACWLGFKWSEANSLGLQTICWRHDWVQTGVETAKMKLIVYNVDDCAALARACEVVLRLGRPVEKAEDTATGLDITKVDELLGSNTMWPTFSSSIPGFEAINKEARWDYQRDRIYVKTDRVVGRVSRKAGTKSSRSLSINKETAWSGPVACPRCGRVGRNMRGASRILYDLRFGQKGVYTTVVRYNYPQYYCKQCRSMYGRPEVFRGGSMYGYNVVGIVVYMLIDLCMTQRSIANGLNTMFKLGIHEREVNRMKGSASQFYDLTRQTILARMLSGGLIHADETSIIIKRRRAYVWVFATLREVVYFYSDSREGEFLRKSIDGFAGVLVSDFYAPYDSVACPQQKCLIHLMRDLNDAVLDHPYNEEVKGIAASFANLLSRILQTIDRRGLKRYYLQKHHRDVDMFYRNLSRTPHHSETATKLQERFDKNHDKLFTFLNYDGVPWNNNNAEHAIKAFARLRKAVEGLTTPKGIEEYLVLLSICQTCKYMGVDFLDFLRSGEKDVYTFSERCSGRKPSLLVNHPNEFGTEQ